MAIFAPAGATLNVPGDTYTPTTIAGNTGYIIGNTGAPVTNPASTAQSTATTPSSILSTTTPTNTTDATSALTSGDIQYLTDQASQLQDLLNRTSTGETQGLAANDAAYQNQLKEAGDANTAQLQNYTDQTNTQNTNKLGAYDTINQNANAGYSSLAQLIGRASGTGSSAFQDLLPQVVGTDTSNKRQAASSTYGTNLANIANSENSYNLSYQDQLNDLLNQKKANESTLENGIETQRQSINSQLADNAAQVAEANGGGAAAVASAEQPYQTAITNSRNAVDSFFNQFAPSYNAASTVAAPVNLSDYTTDRSTVNANANPTTDVSNPYTSLLLKKLQQGNS